MSSEHPSLPEGFGVSILDMVECESCGCETTASYPFCLACGNGFIASEHEKLLPIEPQQRRQVDPYVWLAAFAVILGWSLLFPQLIFVLALPIMTVFSIVCWVVSLGLFGFVTMSGIQFAGLASLLVAVAWSVLAWAEHRRLIGWKFASYLAGTLGGLLGLVFLIVHGTAGAISINLVILAMAFCAAWIFTWFPFGSLGMFIIGWSRRSRDLMVVLSDDIATPRKRLPRRWATQQRHALIFMTTVGFLLWVIVGLLQAHPFWGGIWFS